MVICREELKELRRNIITWKKRREVSCPQGHTWRKDEERQPCNEKERPFGFMFFKE
jgi:hypothetical protein